MIQQHSSCLGTICSSHSGQQKAEALCDEPVGRSPDSFIQFGPGNRCMQCQHVVGQANGTEEGVV